MWKEWLLKNDKDTVKICLIILNIIFHALSTAQAWRHKKQQDMLKMSR